MYVFPRVPCESSTFHKDMPNGESTLHRCELVNTEYGGSDRASLKVPVESILSTVKLLFLGDHKRDRAS